MIPKAIKETANQRQAAKKRKEKKSDGNNTVIHKMTGQLTSYLPAPGSQGHQS